MADKKKKKVKISYDKANEIKPLVAYFAIVDQGNANAIVEIFRRAGSTASFIQMGRGTASKHVRDILGIEDNRKEIVYSLVREDYAEDIQKELSAYFMSAKRNKGVGFSIKLNSIVGVKLYKFFTQTIRG